MNVPVDAANPVADNTATPVVPVGTPTDPKTSTPTKEPPHLGQTWLGKIQSQLLGRNSSEPTDTGARPKTPARSRSRKLETPKQLVAPDVGEPAQIVPQTMPDFQDAGVQTILQALDITPTECALLADNVDPTAKYGYPPGERAPPSQNQPSRQTTFVPPDDPACIQNPYHIPTGYHEQFCCDCKEQEAGCACVKTRMVFHRTAQTIPVSIAEDERQLKGGRQKSTMIEKHEKFCAWVDNIKNRAKRVAEHDRYFVNAPSKWDAPVRTPQRKRKNKNVPATLDDALIVAPEVAQFVHCASCQDSCCTRAAKKAEHEAAIEARKKEDVERRKKRNAARNAVKEGKTGNSAALMNSSEVLNETGAATSSSQGLNDSGIVADMNQLNL